MESEFEKFRDTFNLFEQVSTLTNIQKHAKLHLIFKSERFTHALYLLPC